MEIPFLGAALAALLVAVPFLLNHYVQRLPVAPLCPSCSALTRAAAPTWCALHLLPALATTFVGECGRCGWRGRMRWRWATRSARGRDDR